MLLIIANDNSKKNNSFIVNEFYYYIVGAHWNCLNEAIPMCTNNMLLKLRKPIVEIYIYQESCPFALFKTFHAANKYQNTCHYMYMCIWQIVYIYMTATSPNSIS